jgi:hypothetical protein
MPVQLTNASVKQAHARLNHAPPQHTVVYEDSLMLCLASTGMFTA